MSCLLIYKNRRSSAGDLEEYLQRSLRLNYQDKKNDCQVEGGDLRHLTYRRIFEKYFHYSPYRWYYKNSVRLIVANWREWFKENLQRSLKLNNWDKKYDCHAVGGDLRHMMWRKILPFLIMEIVWKTNGCQVIRNRWFAKAAVSQVFPLSPERGESWLIICNWTVFVHKSFVDHVWRICKPAKRGHVYLGAGFWNVIAEEAWTCFATMGPLGGVQKQQISTINKCTRVFLS